MEVRSKVKIDLLMMCPCVYWVIQNKRFNEIQNLRKYAGITYYYNVKTIPKHFALLFFKTSNIDCVFSKALVFQIL
jgi:hypothetical protein